MSTDYQNLIFNTNDENLHIFMKEFDVTQKFVDDSFERLRDWYRLQPHFPKIELDDRILIRVLTTNGYSVEKAKIKLDNLFLARSKMPEFFNNRDPHSPEIKQVFETVYWGIMPKPTNEHHRVNIMSIRSGDPNLFNCEAAFKSLFMLIDLKLTAETATGEHIVWDCTHTKLGHVVKMTPVIIKKVLFIIERCYGARIKGIHLVNAPSYTSSVVTAGKLVLKKKIVERVFVHKTLEDLHKHVSPKYLPKELGGDEKSVADISETLLNTLQSEEIMGILKYFDTLKSDESKRLTASDNVFDDLLGITGTFRKLDVD